MNKLETKAVDFNGTQLMAAQDSETGKIYVGVSWICNGLGFSKSQKDWQVGKIQSDTVLRMGCLLLQAGVLDSDNEALALELDFLPLWLAKIPVSQKLQKEQPEAAERLIEYQLKAKDVLASAFVQPEAEQSVFTISAKERGAGETASLLKVVIPELRRNNTPQHIIVKYIHTTLSGYNHPVLPIEEFVQPPPSYEQLTLVHDSERGYVTV